MNEQRLNSITTDLIVRKLDVRELSCFVVIVFGIMKFLGIQKVPVQWEKAPMWIREKYLDLYPEYRNYTSGPETLKQTRINIHKVLDFILRMNKDNCKTYKKEELELSGDTDFGSEEFFQNEAKMALRLANFISAFLQVTSCRNV